MNRSASDQPSAPPAIELFCPACAYNLGGIDSERCPECGFEIDRTAAAASRIPWEHRCRLGRVRAYWRTMWMSTRVLAGEVVRPVNYRDARRFQLVTVLIASLPLIALAALPMPLTVFTARRTPMGAWPMAVPPGWAIDLALPFLAGVGLRALPVAIVLYLLAMSGAASYFFHPHHLTTVQQNRAIALSYYACRPLVLLVIPALLGWASLLLHVNQPAWGNKGFLEASLMGTAAVFMLIITLLLLWVGYIRMLRHATLCSTVRAIALAVTLPIAWLVLAVMILVGLPWVVGFGMMVAWSFQ